MTQEKNKQPLIRRILKAAAIIAAAAAVYYILFLAYIPQLGAVAVVDEVEITQKQAIRECPDIVITDYDREFLDKLITDPRILAVEADAIKENDYRSIKLTADEAGFERYAPCPDENYTIYAYYSVNGIMPLNANVDFERTDGSYVRELYMSVDKDEYSDSGERYTKAITVTRSDGKFISRYWCFHGKYRKEIFKYGLVSYAESIFSAIMSV